MVRRRCVCGGPLNGLDSHGPRMFGFIPSSSLAHYNYDCEFDAGVTLPGGRVLEQCANCGAMVLCEYPTLDGSLRGDDPLITYGPGTVYEQCDIASVPVTYRSFRALMSSGVTGGVMYSGQFRTALAGLFRTDERRLPSWKVVKDALLDPANHAMDEWWFASIGRNFIVLYENSKVLHIVGAWHRIPGTEIKNSHIVRINELNGDPLRERGRDTDEMIVSDKELEISDERRRMLAIGNEARLRLIDSSIWVGAGLRDLAQWAGPDALMRGAEIMRDGGVRQIVDTAFGIRHAVVDDAGDEEHVDLLLRHDVVAKVSCTCRTACAKHVCAHIVAMVLELARRYSFRIPMPGHAQDRSAHADGDAVQGDGRDRKATYDHYADVVSIMREQDRYDTRYAWLTSYIEPFEAPKEALYHVEFMPVDPHGLHNVGYCVYGETVLSFIDLIITRGDGAYLSTLRRYGLDKDVRLDILNIDSMDGALLLALVSMIVYRERRNEGYLAECFENGILVRMLRRLRDIDNEMLERRSAEE